MEVDIKKNKLLMFSWKLKKLYEKMFYSTIKELLLTQNEIDVLLFLYNNKPLDTAKDIAKYRAISKAMISKSTVLLYKKGYLSYEVDKIDKRCIHLEIEPIVIPVIHQLLLVQKKFSDIIYRNITKEETEVIESILNKIQQSITNEINREINSDGRNKKK